MTIYKKIAMSFYSGILSYFIIAPIFGERGFVNYQKLDNNLTLIKNHIEKLKEIQKELKARYINLQVSKSEILKEAKKLGYYPKNSTVIKTNNNKDQYNQGQILTLQKPLSKNQNFYLISIAIGLIYYFLSSCIIQTKKITKSNKLASNNSKD
ncbi:septum formation initiator family protein [Borreliella burgdorferi]|uniref:Septum formation initiator family protein n=2 Tax=Borreliella burgdorferi TaxID=139 RepID=A0A7U8EXL4_BORBG|nr:septum formation initiator family protein [Borreliella burgdorferi]EOA79839.1 putative septum formation initiator subfamily protein [Borreliella burgdorferi CA8]ACK74775.1 putative septum formation initiator subfamily protein [Borreliella burgdorferi ZS7]ADQ29822.1 septum formation initiator subfamily, putative [Borreliella burgdorferi N40]ADQ31123.1 septum formation initiator subfamily, putative [Borreliella burgdorferi JD1]ATH10273.1 septum formation initiator family protein [Borreliella 